MTENPLFEVFNVIFQFVGAGVCGGLIVLMFAHVLSISRDNYVKRKQFRHYIKLLREKIKSKQSAEFVNDLHRTARDMDGFENATREVTGHIRCRNIARFDAACTAYKNVSFGGFNEEKNEQARENL